ncbi:polymer-forming cytoskeletal protein [Nitrosomonas sp.]|uniref:bactofilin family protein n=1 Tax=Nitrosomonas sp. TaxID=42353 RepID=UPI001D41534D|nr:polymer-forming cytoskeletal protein [Nitrosomonas sp.]MCB1949816.1 polymer-forming cytoskeletal protein [Nitrosomonas sp.]MDR4514390.1 polymer-forming cytoskeletal protein [Nitrosomonas sp.]
MFGKKKKTKLHNHIDTLIGTQTQITGDIRFSGGLRVDGNINGNVIAEEGEQHTLILSNAGYVDGKIQVANVIINGTVKGPIHASRYLELQENAQIHGDVYYGSIEVKLGASVDGKMIHQDKLQSDKLVTLIPAASE